MERWDTGVTEANVQNDGVSDFLSAVAVINAFGVKNKGADTKSFGPRHIDNAVLLWVNRVI